MRWAALPWPHPSLPDRTSRASPCLPAASYQRSLLRAFQRAVEEGRFPFIVVDAPAIRVRQLRCACAAPAPALCTWNLRESSSLGPVAARPP